MPCDCFFDADRDVRVASDKTGRLSLRLDHMLRVVRPGAFVVIVHSGFCCSLSSLYVKVVLPCFVIS